MEIVLSAELPVVITEPGIMVKITAEDIIHLQETRRMLQLLEDVKLLLALYILEEKPKIVLILTSKDGEKLEKNTKNLLENQKRKYPDIEYEVFKYEKFGGAFLCKEPIMLTVRNQPTFIIRYPHVKHIIEALKNAFGEGIFEAIHLIFREIGKELAQYYGNYLTNEPIEKLIEFVLIGSAFVGWLPKIKSVKCASRNEVIVEFALEEFRKATQGIWANDQEVVSTFSSIARGLVDGFLEVFGYESRTSITKENTLKVNFHRKI